jgi:hypothetical protein
MGRCSHLGASVVQRHVEVKVYAVGHWQEVVCPRLASAGWWKTDYLCVASPFLPVGLAGPKWASAWNSGTLYLQSDN